MANNEVSELSLINHTHTTILMSLVAPLMFRHPFNVVVDKVRRRQVRYREGHC